VTHFGTGEELFSATRVAAASAHGRLLALLVVVAAAGQPAEAAQPELAVPEGTSSACVSNEPLIQWQPDPIAPGRRVLHVGPRERLKSPAAAATEARDGDVILIEGGDYAGDTAVWPQNDLLLRGVHGRPRMIAQGPLAEGKAIWVIKGENVTVENVEFSGARVPSLNGAGIRAEGTGLTVRASRFLNNQMGLLTDNDDSNSLVVEFSEFGFNGMSDGRYHHGLYAGRIGSLTVRFSYFHHGLDGHLLKSRAQVNDVRYSRFIDGENGQASYELEFPESGDVTILGNVVDQSATSPNEHVISYAAEAKGAAGGRVLVAYNTMLTRRPGTVFVTTHASRTVRVAFNVFAGADSVRTQGALELTGNALVSLNDFQNSGAGDYRLTRSAAQKTANISREPAQLDRIRPMFEPTGVMAGKERTDGVLPMPGAFAACAGEPPARPAPGSYPAFSTSPPSM